jgi:glutamate-1-semialdehyde 2,1-aminomutase
MSSPSNAQPAQRTPAQQHLQLQIDKYIKDNPKSEKIVREAGSVLPGGTTRAVLLYTPFPLVFSGGKDTYLRSVDGEDYLDFVSEYCAGMFGHSHPDIVAAIDSIVKRGFTLGGATETEGELAAALTQRFPSVDAIRFCNSGTEANTLAIATGLAYTQRKKVSRTSL